MQTRVQKWGNSLALANSQVLRSGSRALRGCGRRSERGGWQTRRPTAGRRAPPPRRPARGRHRRKPAPRVERGAGRRKGNLVKTKRGYVPGRGDAVWITLDPQSGHEQRGDAPRPDPVARGLQWAGRIGAALTITQVKDYPFEVALPEGLPLSGVVLADQVKSLDWQAERQRASARSPNPWSIRCSAGSVLSSPRRCKKHLGTRCHRRLVRPCSRQPGLFAAVLLQRLRAGTA